MRSEQVKQLKKHVWFTLGTEMKSKNPCEDENCFLNLGHSSRSSVCR